MWDHDKTYQAVHDCVEAQETESEWMRYDPASGRTANALRPGFYLHRDKIKSIYHSKTSRLDRVGFNRDGQTCTQTLPKIKKTNRPASLLHTTYTVITEVQTTIMRKLTVIISIHVTGLLNSYQNGSRFPVKWFTHKPTNLTKQMRFNKPEIFWHKSPLNAKNLENLTCLPKQFHQSNNIIPLRKWRLK